MKAFLTVWRALRSLVTVKFIVKLFLPLGFSTLVHSISSGAHKRKERTTRVIRVVISKHKPRRFADPKNFLIRKFLEAAQWPCGSSDVINPRGRVSYLTYVHKLSSRWERLLAAVRKLDLSLPLAA